MLLRCGLEYLLLNKNYFLKQWRSLKGRAFHFNLSAEKAERIFVSIPNAEKKKFN
jgi:hypothetical protein